MWHKKVYDFKKKKVYIDFIISRLEDICNLKTFFLKV